MKVFELFDIILTPVDGLLGRLLTAKANYSKAVSPAISPTEIH